MSLKSRAIKATIRAAIKLVRSKKKVWRGSEKGYKSLRGQMWPEEYSGRFFSPDKGLAEWYAIRQGTLTGKVKKLKLSAEEFKTAQKAARQLKVSYGDDLLVPKELSKKAKIDLISTAKAKAEALIRKITKKAEGGEIVFGKNVDKDLL